MQSWLGDPRTGLVAELSVGLLANVDVQRTLAWTLTLVLLHAVAVETVAINLNCKSQILESSFKKILLISNN